MYLSVCLSIYLSIYLFICLSIYLFVYLSFYFPLPPPTLNVHAVSGLFSSIFPITNNKSLAFA